MVRMECPGDNAGNVAALCDRIRQGDSPALAAAFDARRERLLRTIYFRMRPQLRARLDPDDVLQEAYLAAARRCTHLEGDTEVALFIWLRLIVLQTITDVERRHLGAQQRAAGREVDLRAQLTGATTSVSLAIGLAGSLTTPSAALQRAELTEQLRQALEQMDEIDREVLALRHFEELANREVAAALAIAPKAASVRYIRALRRLKEVLTGIMPSLNGAPALPTPPAAESDHG